MSEIILSSPLPLDQNPAAVYIGSLAAKTGQRTQAQALRCIARIFHTDIYSMDWAALRYQHTAMIRSKIAQAYSPATANKILSALRQTLRQAWLLGQMTADDYNKAINLKPITGETIPAGRELSQDEIKALMDVCKNDEKRNSGIRDAAIIALLCVALLRREEAVNLNIEDYDPQTGKLVLIGKRNKQRTEYITNGAQNALNDWLTIRGSQPGPLFISINKSDKLGKFENMSPQVIYNVVDKRSKEAGITDNSPHNFRRTTISNLLDMNVDIVTIAALAGHKNLQTTQRYDRRGERAKQHAASLVEIPY